MSSSCEAAKVVNIVVENIPGLRVRQWFGESQAVTFNPISGNTFEINESAAKLLKQLECGSLTVSEALLASGLYETDLDVSEQEQQFLRDYLNPLHQLDLVHLRKL